MTAIPEPVWQTLAEHLGDPTTSWNVATFGALAEFHRDPGEAAAVELGDDAASVRTARGAIGIRRDPDARIVPFEGISRIPTAWTQGAVVCLPRRAARMAMNEAITPLGLDMDSLDPETADGRLFDLGLGAVNIDACVRTDDRALIRILEANAGRSLFDPDNPAIRAIKDTSPTRVFRSRLGRVEVYQRIGSSAGSVPTPAGPHTHVLPDLLRKKRTHAATVPIPAGLIPALGFFPANPVRDDMGETRPFDPVAYRRFADLFERFADPDLRAAKGVARDGVRAGQPVDAGTAVKTRAGRTAMRIALRQLWHTDGPSPALELWKKRFDPTSGRGALDGHDH